MEEYFKKFFQNDILFRKGYENVKADEILLTARSILVNWRRPRPYMLTSCALEHHRQGSGQSVPTLVKSLGQLAEKGILAQQVLFDEKTIYEMVSDPASSLFLCKFLF